MIIEKTHKDLKPVLKEPDLPGVRISCFILSGEDVEEQVTILSPGKNGSEFNKTHGYFQSLNGTESFHCTYGQGVLLLQRNDENGNPKEVKVVTLRPGIGVEIPSGFGQAVVNTGKSFLIIVDNAAANSKYHDTKPLTDNRGLAYYLIEKRGEPALEKNPNYAYHPEIMLE